MLVSNKSSNVDKQEFINYKNHVQYKVLHMIFYIYYERRDSIDVCSCGVYKRVNIGFICGVCFKTKDYWIVLQLIIADVS